MKTLLTILAITATIAPLLAGGCGGDDGSSRIPGGTDSTGGTDGGDGLVFGGSGGAGFGVARPCTATSDCTGGDVCHPVASVCVTPAGSCDTHADCGTGHGCDAASDTCLPGLPGSPCATADNCSGLTRCESGVCACSEFSQEQDETPGPLDIFFIFDRTNSMGQDCPYVHGQSPSTSSKACYATYAVADYLIEVDPVSDTRLAFDFMSYPNGCDGSVYVDPLIGLTPLPVPADHSLITAIDAEDFSGGSGTRIEDALRGIARFTTAARTEGREMIGVLMTDGDATDHCEEDIDTLATILSDHYQATGIRTFIIGMQGATESALEQLAIAGGAEPHDDFCGDLAPPCHYWNVGVGSGAAIADALRAIAAQATPLPCEYPLDGVTPPSGMSLDLNTLNVRLTEPDGSGTTIVQVASASACPTDQPAWFYDDPSSPTRIELCRSACDLVTAAESGTQVHIVGGCTATLQLR
jgi:hypothetical protein